MATKKELKQLYDLRVNKGWDWSDIYLQFPHLKPSSCRRYVNERIRREAPNFQAYKDFKSQDPKSGGSIPQHKIQLEENGDDAIAFSVSTTIKTLDQLLEAAEVDTEVWQVRNWIANCWEQGQKGKGGPIKVTLYQIKAFLIRRKELEITGLIDDMREDIQKLAKSKRKDKKKWRTAPALEPSSKMLELSIPDLHYGKWAWEEESGEAYDMDIAEGLFKEVVQYYLVRTKGEQIDRILFPIGNDLFNADNIAGTTTFGTPQDMHGSHRQHFRRVRYMLWDVIDELAEIAPVYIPIVPGNHDSATTHFLGASLEDRYYKSDRIFIDNSPKSRKYHRFGKVLLGFTHGNEERANDLPMLMPNEVPHEWHKSTVRELHCGHWHKKKETKYLPVTDIGGVRVRIIPSLCAADEWHYRKGYIGGRRGAEAYLWSYDGRTCDILAYNILPDLP